MEFKKAESFLNQHQIDSAFYYFDQVATTSKDSLEAAMAYNYMASIQSNVGDNYGAQESLTTSLSYLDEKQTAHYYCLASNYNELGMTSSNMENFKEAIDYFNLAIKFSKDKSYTLVLLNNKANAFRDMGAYAQALVLYKKILLQTQPQGNEYARLLNNMASTKWLQNPKYNAAPELLKALRIRESSEDIRGQNSSYSHLANYYHKSKPDSSLYFAGKMYEIAKKLKSPDAQLDALQKLIKLNPIVNANRYFIRYEQLNDSLQRSRNAAKNQFALIRYHTEKSKTDNLILQKENSERRLELIRERIRFYAVLSIFTLAILIAIFWYKKRKRRNEKEKQEAILENQRKASKRVHDTLANDLYRIMKTVQFESEPSPAWLIDNLDDVYQRARDLSYDIVTEAENFELKIATLLKSFATETTRVV
ncbi:MAG: tetratricopeptide repeat protein, partial [Sphingobacteriales bacterium]